MDATQPRYTAAAGKQGSPASASAASAPPPAAALPTHAAAAARKPHDGAEPIVTALKSVPCTVLFPPAGPELADALPAPHVPRAAGGAVSLEHPHPQAAASEAEAAETPLQHHVSPFFRPAEDGAVYPPETFRGFHAIGFNWLLSAVAVMVIHCTFAAATAPSLFAFLKGLPKGGPVYVSRLDRGLHGSHSGTYDTEGRFIPAKFEDIFSKFGDARLGGIRWRGVLQMLWRQRSIFDPVGMTAAFLEWGGLYWVAADHEEGVLYKEDVRAMFDGTLWEKLAQRTAARRGQAYGHGHGRGYGQHGGGGGVYGHGGFVAASSERPHAA